MQCRQYNTSILGRHAPATVGGQPQGPGLKRFTHYNAAKVKKREMEVLCELFLICGNIPWWTSGSYGPLGVG